MRPHDVAVQYFDGHVAGCQFHLNIPADGGFAGAAESGKPDCQAGLWLAVRNHLLPTHTLSLPY